MTVGIYLIRCTVTGEVYVGSSLDVERRWGDHRRDLRKARHKNPRLQTAWKRHGEDAFTFDLIEEVAVDAMLARETELIIAFDACARGVGFNIMPTAYSRLGTRHTADTLTKMSEAARGNTARLGMPHLASTKLKISLAQSGRAKSDLHRAKLSAAGTGKVPSAVTRARLSAAHKGKPKPEGFGRRLAQTRSLFDEAQINEVRSRHAAGESMRGLAREFGTSHVVIGKVINRLGSFYSSV